MQANLIARLDQIAWTSFMLFGILIVLDGTVSCAMYPEQRDVPYWIMLAITTTGFAGGSFWIAGLWQRKKPAALFRSAVLLLVLTIIAIIGFSVTAATGGLDSLRGLPPILAALRYVSGAFIVWLWSVIIVAACHRRDSCR